MNFDDLFKKDDDVEEGLTRLENSLTDKDRLYIIKERQREKLFSDVIQLYYKGRTYAEIERELNISYQQVKYAIVTVQSRLKESNKELYVQRRNEQIARLDNIIREMWEAWDRSKKIDRKVNIKRATIRASANNPNPNANTPSIQEVEEQIEETAGNIDYMKAIMWCEAEKSKLEGLHAPKKIATTDTDGNNVGSARDELINALQLMKERNDTYNNRKNKEAIDAEIIKEVDRDISNINPSKPTKLLSQGENEDN